MVIPFDRGITILSASLREAVEVSVYGPLRDAMPTTVVLEAWFGMHDGFALASHILADSGIKDIKNHRHRLPNPEVEMPRLELGSLRVSFDSCRSGATPASESRDTAKALPLGIKHLPHATSPFLDSD